MNGPADFFRTMLPYARRVSELTGVDPRLVLAQSALETGYGKSAPGQNFFGIKAPAGQGQGLMTMEYEGGQMVPRREAFRTYDDPSQSFQDYANLLLRNDRYAPVREARTLEDQIRAMGSSGYATDPEYANKLRSIAMGIDLNDPSLIASDAMGAIGRGPDTSSMMATTEARPAMNGRQMMPGLLAQDAAATAQPMPAQAQAPARDYGNLLDALAIGFSGMSMRPNQGLIQLAQSRMKRRQTQAERNATADWLESQGMTQYAEAVRRGTISGAEALTMARGGEATAAQRNYEFLISQGVEPETAMQRAFSGGTTINMPGDQLKIMPDGRIAISDPTVEGGVRFVTPPGSAAGAEQQTRAGQQQAAAATAQDSIRLIDSVLNDPNLASVTGMIQGRIPPVTQAGTDLVTKIEQLQGQAFLQAFESLKGGGAITEREGLAAQNAIARLNRAQSEAAFRESLQDLRDIVERGRRRAAGENVTDETNIGGVTVGEPY